MLGNTASLASWSLVMPMVETPIERLWKLAATAVPIDCMRPVHICRDDTHDRLSHLEGYARSHVHRPIRHPR